MKNRRKLSPLKTLLEFPIPALKYIWVTIKHKYFVYKAGRVIGLPVFQLLVHDLSKFTLSELPYYGRQFYSDDKDRAGFDMAWNHHQKSNKHHWEYWIMPNKGADGHMSRSLITPPDKYIKEMCADWLGASRAYDGEYPTDLMHWSWYQDNFSDIVLAVGVKERCVEILKDYFDKVNEEEMNNEFRR